MISLSTYSNFSKDSEISTIFLNYILLFRRAYFNYSLKFANYELRNNLYPSVSNEPLLSFLDIWYALAKDSKVAVMNVSEYYLDLVWK